MAPRDSPGMGSAPGALAGVGIAGLGGPDGSSPAQNIPAVPVLHGEKLLLTPSGISGLNVWPLLLVLTAGKSLPSAVGAG